MDLTKPDGIGELNISRMTIIANGFELDFEGQVEGYGAVFCSHLLTYISGDENRGTLTGEARTFLNDGKVICTPHLGHSSASSLKFTPTSQTLRIMEQ